MANIDVQLEQQLNEAGKKLSHPSDSIDELLSLLDQLEKLLSKVDQSPKKSMLDALKPSMKALVQESLLKHSVIDVKVSVASCASQITRITAPDAPYDDDQMRDIFQLIVSSFKDIADQSSRSYIKRASILETVSTVRSCVIMLDLECDALIVEMFEHFLRSVRDYHHESIYPSMESIMVLVLEESEEISVEMLKPLLATVKKDSEGVLSVARKLVEGVLLKSADKLKPYLMPAIVSLGDTLDKYTKVVASVCEGKTAAVEHNDEIAFGVQPVSTPKPVEAKPANVSSPSQSNSLPDESCAKKAVQSKKKQVSQEDEIASRCRATKTVMEKEVKPPPKGESEDDEATSESDAEPQKQTGKKAVAAKDVKLPPKDDSEGDEATRESDAKPQKRTGKKAAAAKELTLPPKGDSEDDETTSESDAKPQKRTGKKAAAAKEVKLPPKDESEDDEAPSESDAPPLKSTKELDKKSKLSWKKMDVGESNAKKPKQTGKKVDAKVEDSNSEAKPLKLSVKKGKKSKPTAEEEEESDSENKPLKLSAKKGNSKKKDGGRKRGSVKNATENDQAKAMSSDDEMDYSPKSAAKSAKSEGSSKEIPVNSAKRKRSAVKDKVSDPIKYDKSLVGLKVKVRWPEDMYYEGVIESFDAAKKKHKVLFVDGEKETLNLKTEKWEILKEFSVCDEEQTIEVESEEASPETHKKKKSKTYVAPSASHDKIKDSAKRAGGVSSSGKTKGPASKDNKSKDKSAAKSTSQKTNGKSSDAATTSNSKKDEETPKDGTKTKQDTKGVLPVTRKLGEEVSLKSTEKLNTYLIPAIISMGDTLDNYTKDVASVCETASIEHYDENASGLQPASECKLEKESKYKAHQADESKLTTASSDHTGRVFKEGACPGEVDPTLDRSIKSVMINGVDVTGNQEASVDLEPSKKPEKEVINQESLDKKDTDGSNKDKESKPEDQASKKSGKEADTVINSTEPMVGLAHKRASGETSDGSTKNSRVSRVAGSSSLIPPPVSCSTDATVEGRESDSTASGHFPLGDKDVMRYPSHQMFRPGASTPAMEERARQMGLSGVVDRLKGMANESAALFSHAAESICALELDNLELKRQLNELVLRDKGYYEKISVLEREVADLKSLGDRMKLTCEARVVDANRRATEAERRFAEAKRKMETENFKLKKQLDEYVLCDQGYKEKIRKLEREVADLKSLDEQMKLSLEARAVDAERRATEAEKRLAEAKRKMVEAEGTVKAALASFAL